MPASENRIGLIYEKEGSARGAVMTWERGVLARGPGEGGVERRRALPAAARRRRVGGLGSLGLGG